MPKDTMRERDWAELRYFKPAEFARPEMMNRSLLVRLDAFRHRLGRPLTVSSSHREPGQVAGSAAGSYHYPRDLHGVLAVDVVPEGNVVGAYLQAELSGAFGGIGLMIEPDALHLDCRQLVGATWARWYRWGPQGTQYLPITADVIAQAQLREQLTPEARTAGVGAGSLPLLGALAVVVLSLPRDD